MKLFIHMTVVVALSIYGGVLLFNYLLNYQIEEHQRSNNASYELGYQDGKKATIQLTDGTVVSWCDYIKMDRTNND